MARNVIFGEEKKIWQSVDVLDQAVVQAMAEVVRVAHNRVGMVAAAAGIAGVVVDQWLLERVLWIWKVRACGHLSRNQRFRRMVSLFHSNRVKECSSFIPMAMDFCGVLTTTIHASEQTLLFRPQ